MHLHRTTFARANTDGVRFVGASVSQDGCRRRARARDPARLHRLLVQGLDLHDADLRGIRVVGASLSDAKLAGARLNDAQLIGVSARDADLSRTDLRGANLIGASLRDAKLSGATIGDAVLCSENRGSYRDDGENRRTVCADLRGVDLHGLDLRAARWCSNDDDHNRSCRTVTRRELTDFAHADLTGAQAPA